MKDNLNNNDLAIKISIIVPVYNVESYLEKFINSILKQTYENYELLLIDDGSTDSSGQICDEYKVLDKRIKVIHQLNQGSNMAKNKGMDLSTGMYLYFCDPDDYLDPDLLKDNLLLLKNKDANLIIFGHYDTIMTSKKEFKISRHPQKTEFLEEKIDFRSRFKDLYTESLMFNLWNKIYKKSFIIENNFRFESVKIGEDTRFNYQVYRDLDKVWVNNHSYYHYIMQRQGSATTKYDNDRFPIRCTETQRFEALIDYWGYQEKYRNIIINDWLLTLMEGVKNLFHESCPLNNREKKEEIKRYTNIEPIKDALNIMTFKMLLGSNKSKAQKMLLKYIRNGLVFQLFKFLYGNKFLFDLIKFKL